MTIGFEARKLAKICRSGALATIDCRDGSPYASFCAVAFDHLGQPVFLLSDLADHTRNIRQNPKVSFLCEQASQRSNPQSGPRVTLTGAVTQVKQQNLKDVFLQIHPSAQMYMNFADFNFYILNVEKAHFVGGFGQAQWLEAEEYLGDSAAHLNFSNMQQRLIAHLNADFPELAVSCATKLLKQRGKNWQLLRIDPDGMDLKLASKIVRYPFEKELKTEDDLRNIAYKICA
jgi:putative heme iron utilization protein